MPSPIEQIQRRTVTPSTEARVLEMADAESEDVLDALSSKTRREAYQTLFEDPATTSELADRLDTSVQNVHHHLSVLSDVGLVEPIDTVYSNRGNEMKVYGPASDPLVFVGERGRLPRVERTLRNAVSGLALLGVASLLVQWGAEHVWRTSFEPVSAVGTAGYPDGGLTAVETVAWFLFEIVEPGVFFFVSCLLVAALVLRLSDD
ncbi:MAG: ArsR/SmtB family transcription factor [Haloferacaceae archaeon]